MTNQIEFYVDGSAINNENPNVPTLGGIGVYRRTNTENGINIITSSRVTSVQKSYIHMKNGFSLKADLIIWVAGIKAPDWFRQLDGLAVNQINQLMVTPTLQTTVDENIFSSMSSSHAGGSFINRDLGGGGETTKTQQTLAGSAKRVPVFRTNTLSTQHGCH